MKKLILLSILLFTFANVNYGNETTALYNNVEANTVCEHNKSEQTVYISSSRSKVYHTNRNCPSLSRSKNVKKVSIKEAKKRGLRQCKRC